MRNIFLLLVAGALSACSASPPDVRTPSSASGEARALAQYEEGAREFQAQVEARRGDVSNERHLPVFSGLGHPSETVVVLLHGMYESPFYVKGLRRDFEARGYNVWVPLLRHHWAQPLEDLDNARYQEWVSDTIEDLRNAHKLGKRVLVAGHSTGGLLAVYVAISHPELVDGLLLWSPALELKLKTALGSAFGHFAERVGETLNFNKLAGKPPPDPVTVAYYSPNAGREVSELGRMMLADYLKDHPWEARNQQVAEYGLYSAIKVPVLLFFPADDEVVARQAVESFWEAVSGPKTRYDLKHEDHSSAPKGPDDFVPGIQRANRDFPGMLEKVNQFLDENFPDRAR